MFAERRRDSTASDVWKREKVCQERDNAEGEAQLQREREEQEDRVSSIFLFDGTYANVHHRLNYLESRDVGNNVHTRDETGRDRMVRG
jgi:hypothetical protein